MWSDYTLYPMSCNQPIVQTSRSVIAFNFKLAQPCMPISVSAFLSKFSSSCYLWGRQHYARWCCYTWNEYDIRNSMEDVSCDHDSGHLWYFSRFCCFGRMNMWNDILRWHPNHYSHISFFWHVFPGSVITNIMVFDKSSHSPLLARTPRGQATCQCHGHPFAPGMARVWSGTFYRSAKKCIRPPAKEMKFLFIP